MKAHAKAIHIAKSLKKPTARPNFCDKREQNRTYSNYAERSKNQQG